jgi:hypothetical protein
VKFFNLSVVVHITLYVAGITPKHWNVRKYCRFRRKMTTDLILGEGELLAE